MSDAAREAEITLAYELKDLGAGVLVVVNRATAELKKRCDLVIELGLDAPEFVRYAMTAIPAHLIGTAVGLRKGLNPDAPRNLTRAVVLSGTATTGTGTAKGRRK
jgi:glucosamine--fructose-6-phosphate aminotransferase (isomerizing)